MSIVYYSENHAIFYFRKFESLVYGTVRNIQYYKVHSTYIHYVRLIIAYRLPLFLCEPYILDTWHLHDTLLWQCNRRVRRRLSISKILHYAPGKGDQRFHYSAPKTMRYETQSPTPIRRGTKLQFPPPYLVRYETWLPPLIWCGTKFGFQLNWRFLSNGTKKKEEEKKKE